MSSRGRIGRSLAIAAISVLMLAGCGEDSDDSPDQDEPAALDHSDPQAVAEAMGQAVAEGDCEAAAELHVTDSYRIDCSDPDQYNDFIDAKNAGLTFGEATKDEERSDEDEVCYKLSYTDSDGYRIDGRADVELRDGKYLVNSPMYAIVDLPDSD